MNPFTPPFTCDSGSLASSTLRHLEAGNHHEALRELQASARLLMQRMSGPQPTFSSIEDPRERQYAILQEALSIVAGERDDDVVGAQQEQGDHGRHGQ